MIVSRTYPESQRYLIALALSLTLTTALASIGGLLFDFLVAPMFDTSLPAGIVHALLAAVVGGGAAFGLIAARTTT